MHAWWLRISIEFLPLPSSIPILQFFLDLPIPCLNCLYPIWLVLILFQEISPQSEALFWKRTLEVSFKSESRALTIPDPSGLSQSPALTHCWIWKKPSQLYCSQIGLLHFIVTSWGFFVLLLRSSSASFCSLPHRCWHSVGLGSSDLSSLTVFWVCRDSWPSSFCFFFFLVFFFFFTI